MKSIIEVFLLMCVMSSCFSMKYTPEEICELQAKRNALISRLTPGGQLTAHQILLDIQSLGGAALQPLYSSIGKKFNSTFNQIKASPDASKLATLEAFIGVGNINIGVGPLRDSCQDAKFVAALVGSMSSSNQLAFFPAALSLFSGIDSMIPFVLSINKFLDAQLYNRLIAVENPATLSALAAIYE